MNCWRFDLRRKFSVYLNGELDSASIKRIEDHLLDCGSCRTQLARLRNGHRLAQSLPRLKPDRDPWAAIEAQISGQETVRIGTTRRTPSWRAMFRPALGIKPGFAIGTLGVLCLIVALVIAFGNRSMREEAAGALIADALDLREFHTVNIADIRETGNPHVMTEGYVSEVMVNDEDGDLSFKLVNDLGRPGPFIVCEIIDPIKLAPPSVGSRVRVYGVSRYDGQADHNWYEVHPVLNIEVVHR